MSGEATYATLMLQDSGRVRSNQDGNNLRKEGHPAQSSVWRRTALSLMTLCLLLVTGLVTLWIMFLQLSSDTNSDSETLTRLQKITDPQQDNLSEPLNISMKDPTEESLLSQISALLERQEQMATKLCKEFLIHTSGNLTYICKKTTSAILVPGCGSGMVTAAITSQLMRRNPGVTAESIVQTKMPLW
ncbi:C-type lectin domain family 12 member B [Sigmodon hispidus]